jgi:hypothetical protein
MIITNQNAYQIITYYISHELWCQLQSGKFVKDGAVLLLTVPHNLCTTSEVVLQTVMV